MKHKIHIYDLINGAGEENVKLNEVHHYLDPERYRIMIYINNNDINNIKDVFEECKINYLYDSYIRDNVNHKITAAITKPPNKYTKSEFVTNIRDMNIFKMYDISLSTNYEESILSSTDATVYKNTLYSYGKVFYRNNTKFNVPTLLINNLTVIMNHIFFIVIFKDTASIYNDIDKYLFNINGASISNIFILKQLFIMQHLVNKNNMKVINNSLIYLDKYMTNVTYGDIQELKILIELLISQLKIYEQFNKKNIQFYTELKKYNIINYKKYFSNKSDTIYKLQSYINNKYVYKHGLIRPNIKLYTIKDIWKTEFVTAESPQLTTTSKLYDGVSSQLMQPNHTVSEEDTCGCSNDTYCAGDMCYRGCVDIEKHWNTSTCIVDNKCKRGIPSGITLGTQWVACDISKYKQGLPIDKLMNTVLMTNIKLLNAITDNISQYIIRLNDVKTNSFDQVEFYNSKNMSLLTIISSLFLPISFISGWYGMNFMNMPELYYKNSYFILRGFIIVLISLGFWYYYDDIKNLSKDDRKLKGRETR